MMKMPVRPPPPFHIVDVEVTATEFTLPQPRMDRIAGFVLMQVSMKGDPMKIHELHIGSDE